MLKAVNKDRDKARKKPGREEREPGREERDHANLEESESEFQLVPISICAESVLNMKLEYE